MLWITWSNISKFTKGGLHCMNIWFSQYYIRLAKTPFCSRTFGTPTLLSLPFPHPQLLCARCYCRRVAWCSQNSPLFSPFPPSPAASPTSLLTHLPIHPLVTHRHMAQLFAQLGISDLHCTIFFFLYVEIFLKFCIKITNVWNNITFYHNLPREIRDV